MSLTDCTQCLRLVANQNAKIYKNAEAGSNSCQKFQSINSEFPLPLTKLYPRPVIAIITSLYQLVSHVNGLLNQDVATTISDSSTYM